MVFLEEGFDELGLVVLSRVFLGAEGEDCEIRRDEVVWLWQGRNTRLWGDLSEGLHTVLGLIDWLQFLALLLKRFALNQHD